MPDETVIRFVLEDETQGTTDRPAAAETTRGEPVSVSGVPVTRSPAQPTAPPILPTQPRPVVVQPLPRIPAITRPAATVAPVTQSFGPTGPVAQSAAQIAPGASQRPSLTQQYWNPQSVQAVRILGPVPLPVKMDKSTAPDANPFKPREPVAESPLVTTEQDLLQWFDTEYPEVETNAVRDGINQSKWVTEIGPQIIRHLEALGGDFQMPAGGQGGGGAGGGGGILKGIGRFLGLAGGGGAAAAVGGGGGGGAMVAVNTQPMQDVLNPLESLA